MSKRINYLKKLAMILTLGTSVTMTGCVPGMLAEPFDAEEYKKLHYVTEEDMRGVPDNVEKCYSYREVDGKLVMAYKRDNLFIAYNRETKEITTYLKYEFSEKGSMSFGDIYDYIQLYDMKTLKLAVLNSPNMSRCRGLAPYGNINPGYFWDLQDTCDFITLEGHIDLQETYTDEELQALIDELIEFNYGSEENQKRKQMSKN